MREHRELKIKMLNIEQMKFTARCRRGGEELGGRRRPRRPRRDSRAVMAPGAASDRLFACRPPYPAIILHPPSLANYLILT